MKLRAFTLRPPPPCPLPSPPQQVKLRAFTLRPPPPCPLPSPPQQVKLRAFTLRGLMRRMARLAGDGRVGWQPQRAAALRWIAAAASALGGAWWGGWGKVMRSLDWEKGGGRRGSAAVDCCCRLGAGRCVLVLVCERGGGE